jgi:hypothetical protein
VNHVMRHAINDKNGIQTCIQAKLVQLLHYCCRRCAPPESPAAVICDSSLLGACMLGRATHGAVLLTVFAEQGHLRLPTGRFCPRPPPAPPPPPLTCWLYDDGGGDGGLLHHLVPVQALLRGLLLG